LNGLSAAQTLIRRATPADSAQLSQIAFASKAHWGYPDAWMETWRYSLTISEEYISANEVYCAVVEDRLIGFYALTGSARAMTLDHLWVTPERIGAGYGRRLIEHAFHTAAELGANELFIEADPHAEDFYLHMGARRVGEYSYEFDGEKRVLPKLIIPVQAVTG
jgi:GNAT superfamily N-acetyltransferase